MEPAEEARARSAPGPRRRGRRARKPAPGSAPGTLHIDPHAPATRISLLAYDNGTEVTEANGLTVEDLRAAVARWPLVWVNVTGLGDEAVLRGTGELFGLHLLALEDVVNVVQRPKFEEYETSLFIIVRIPTFGKRLESEQLSLFVGQRHVLTFQEREGDCFDPVRERLRKGRRRIRNSGPDYLAYALIDAVIDSYFPVAEQVGERLDDLQEKVIAGDAGEETLGEIHLIRNDLLTLRKLVWRHRDTLNQLIRDDSELIQTETKVYLRDCYDHAHQLVDLVENYRETAASLTELYVSAVSNRLNEVMKVLTVIATIFIPLTFISGVYGMNFEHMPELGWEWSYPACLFLMSAVAVGLLLFFRRRGWL
jgi:magnesium transporter